MIYKTLHDMTIYYMRSRFVYRDNANAYRTRNIENILILPQPRTYYLKIEVFYSGAELWNNLPTELRQATEFKTKSPQF